MNPRWPELPTGFCRNQATRPFTASTWLADVESRRSTTYSSPGSEYLLSKQRTCRLDIWKERDRQWTQKIYRHTYRFQNPLRQNYGHVAGGRKHCADSCSIYPLGRRVCGDATLMTPMPPNVTTDADFVHYIESFTDATFSESQVETICERITESAIQQTRETRRAHIHHVRAKLDGH